MFLPNGVHITVVGTHDEQRAPLSAHVWTETVADANSAISFFEAMGLKVESATVREVETRHVPLEGWTFAK